MWMKIQNFISKNIESIAKFLVVTVLIGWIISKFVPDVDNWIRQQRVIELVALVLIAELIAVVADVRKNLANPLELSQDQARSSQKLFNIISNYKPSSAKVMGLSAGKREDILSFLTRGGWEIKLLIQHPEAAMNDILKHHLREKVQELSNITFINYDKVEIRLYKRPSFFRGTKLGQNCIAIGWYACGEGVYEFFGHSNPVISATQGSSESKILNDFFDRAFDYLWNHPETISFQDYIESLDQTS
jgi:hypothetical protein